MINMETRALTKTFSHIFTNILVAQHGLSKETSLTTRHYISTYKYNNTYIRCLSEIRQSVSVDHCASTVKCSRSVDTTKMSKRNYTYFNSLFPSNPLVQVPIKLFTQKADIESVVYDGIGWAGQPIVKRIHPILPEVYGDMPDLFNTLDNQQPTSPNSHLAMKTEPKTESDTGLKIERVGENLNEENLQSEGLEELKIIGKVLNESLSTKLEKGQEVLTNNIVKIQKALIPKNIKSPTSNKILSSKMKIKNKILKKDDLTVNKGVYFKKTKLKKRKKTIISNSKDNVKLHANAFKSLNNKKAKPKTFIIERKHKIDTSILNQRTDIHNLTSNNVLHVANRQFNTGVALFYPRVSFKVTEKSSTLKGKKDISVKDQVSNVNNMFDNDCTCPELFVVKSKRRKTKICGKAAGTEEKKEIKKWKPKMCLLEAPVKYRNRTFVCASKAQERGKKERKLPKCEKPEKKIAPRVIICAPNLLDELDEKSKKCEKPMEEEKIRKRTKVCKPVLLYAKEITEVKVEKSACINIKKTKSRHTKICPPQKEQGSTKMQLSN